MSLRDASAPSLLDLLSPEDRAKLIGSCEPLAYAFGDVMVRQGDEADAMFIVVSGRCRVVQRADGGDEIVLGTLAAGDVVGETGLLSGGVRTATVRASGDVNALKLSRAAFEDLRHRQPEVERWLAQSSQARLLFSFLKQSSAFSRLPATVIREIATALKPAAFSKGDTLIRQGDPPGPMYLIHTGRLQVRVAGEGVDTRTVAYLREGDVAGEISLLRNVPRTASVEALTDGEALALSPDAFRRLVERWPEFQHAVEERLAGYDFEAEARLPLGFSPELLPQQGFKPGAVTEEAAEEAEESEGEGSPDEPYSTKKGLFRTKRPRRRFHFVRQLDEADCGVACLSMISRTFGRKVSLTRLRELAHTATDGTTLRNICHAAEELGLAARPLRVSRDNLDQLPLPAVLHWEDNHWVVLVEVSADRVRIADPAIGDRWLPRTELDTKWSGYAAIFDLTPAFTQGPGEGSPWGWLGTYIEKWIPTLGKAMGLALVAAVLTLVLPVLTQVIVDRVVVGGAAGALNVVLIGLVATFAFRTFASVLKGWLLAFVAVRLDAAALDYIARRLLALPLSYFQARRAADIQRRLDGARLIRQMAVTSGVSAVLAAVQFLVAVGLMLLYSPRLTALFVLLAPIYGGLMLVSGKKLRRIYDELEASAGKYRSEQLDAIKGIEAVKVTSSEFAFRETLLEQFLTMAKQQFRADLATLSYQSGVEAASFLTSMLFLWLGARATMAGELTLGGFVAFISLVSLAVTPLATFLGHWDELQVAQVLAGRLEDVLLSEPEQGRDRSRLVPVPALAGEVELRGLTFRYGGPDSRPVIRNVSLKVPPGRTVAIVGRSGSGKTTLVKLLAGLAEPTEGAILFDGVDLRTMNYRDLRRKMGFVLQSTHLFAGTVLDNICLGCEPDLDRAVSAARAAAAHEFIERLPLGYSTQVGESGLALSGGQAQRLAIARAIYRNPVIIIMDEATSALDAESERAILDNMDSLFEGRTVFVIAHRLSTIRNADWTVVLEQGEIVEQGTHHDLMDRRGLYFYLVSRQLEQ